MLELKNYITLNRDTILSPNLCDQFAAEDLLKIGELCWQGYEQDEQSRSDWLRRNSAGMDLALQMVKDKTLPWPGCANVAFPLVTIAALQFHAMAYPSLLGSKEIVKCDSIDSGDEESDKELQARASRVGRHMSWQLLSQDKPWEEQEDKAILNLSIVGTNFKKSYYSTSLGHNVSELVLAKDLTVNYWAKSLEDAARKTHCIPLYRNEVHEKVLKGTFTDVLESDWYKSGTVPAGDTDQNRRAGTKPPTQVDLATPIEFLEQHCWLDLDGDGYAEPYIVTFEKGSHEVVRIVTRFEDEDAIERVASGKYAGRIVKITAKEYFTKKSFIPSPDGGFYDIGFGLFLGPLNESCNSIINMLLDSGTRQTTAGGFIGRGAKLRGGNYSLAPFEWKVVEATGDDLKKSIVPMTFNPPSDVLFQLLGLLIDYTNRIAGTTDIMVGENPGQNTPAETTRTMVQMGQRVYTAIYKRIWRGLRDEFQKLYTLNSDHLPVGQIFPGGATSDDYVESPDTIRPQADPHLTTDSMLTLQANALKAASMSTAGYNRDEVERRYLRALKVEDIDKVFIGTEGVPPPEDPKITLQKLKEQGDLQRLAMELEAQQQEFVVSLMEERRVNNAKIIQLIAQAENEAASAQTEAAYAQIALINAQISAAKTENEHLNSMIKNQLEAMKIRKGSSDGNNERGV